MDSKVNEFGDRITKNEICQGIMILVTLATLVGCACVRGCQEIQKKMSKAPVKANIVNQQHIR